MLKNSIKIKGGLILTIIIIISFAGCFLDGDSEDNYYNAWFEDVEPESGTIVETDTVIITGQTSYPERPPISDWASDCPYLPCPESTVIQVSWRNITTGVAGSAESEIRNSCWTFFGWCRCECVHEFTASVPLALGKNDIQIIAIDGAESSDSFTLSVSYQPAPPSNISAVANHEQVTISWDPVPGATSYDLYWSTSRDMTTDTANRIIGVSSPYTLYGLPDYTPHYFLMKTYINDFESRVSELVWAVPGWLTDVVYEAYRLDSYETSIDTDSMNRPYIHASYGSVYSGSNNNIYLTKDLSGWVQLYAADTVRLNADLNLDSTDTPHLSYVGETGPVHDVYSAGTWSQSILEIGNTYGTCLSVDGNNDVHIAYRKYTEADTSTIGEIQYARNVSGFWNVSTVYWDHNISLGANDITSDINGTAYIAYAGDSDKTGVQLYEIGVGIWSWITIDSEPTSDIAIAADLNGHIHLIYTLETGQLKYATNESGAWITESMQNVTDARAPSITVGSDGRVHVAYLDNSRHEFRYTANNSGIWQYYTFEIRDSDITSYGGNTAITVDGNQNAHISYYGYDGLLKYTTNR